ncbi:programmed cell death 1 ligand 1-like isoform X1 [Sebastes fasciatus]|uniref:programmed cell death 1 ligand 1-like isoform X1 n=1 Tax=Sebastes fasciatus TaxID=394691 RepID=UPI003D9F2937
MNRKQETTPPAAALLVAQQSRSLFLWCDRRDSRMKMICSILLLLSLTSCVSGAFVVNVTQTSYQAEENHDITLEWMFPPRTSSSPNSLYINCRLFADLKTSVLFHLHEGVESPESQDEQFTGRVRWDKDVLRDGRIRLHMSRLRINDSGVYMCDMLTGDGGSYKICQLKVTAAADEPKPLRPTMSSQPESPIMSSQPESRGRIGLYVVLTAALLVLCAGL